MSNGRCRLAVALLGLLALGTPSESAATPAAFRSGGLVPDPNGRIAVWGGSFAVARLQLDGERDAGFGRNGIARATFPGFGPGQARDALARADGKVVVAGYVPERCEPARGRQCSRRLAVARFTPSGKPDRSFGGDGIVVTRRRGQALAVAPLPRGRLAVAGRTGGGLPLLARFRADGSLDRDFGSTGVTTVRRLPGVGTLNFGRADGIVVQPGGRTTVAVSGGAPHVRARGLLRFTRKGLPDRGFGDAGFVDVLPPELLFDEYGYGLAALPGGRLLLATTTTHYPRRIALVRLLPDGRIDETFGSEGVALGPTDFPVRSNVDLSVQADGRAVVGAAGYEGAAVARFYPSGSIDDGFASGGIAPPLESWGSRATVSILSDGSIALADADRNLSALLVARYTAGGAAIFAIDVPQ
jgi:uncharacterized delta-60 repeat protein